MKQIEKHPAPEKLLQQITEEAINGWRDMNIGTW